MKPYQGTGRAETYSDLDLTLRRHRKGFSATATATLKTMGPSRVLLVVLTITLVCSGLASESRAGLKKSHSVRDLLRRLLKRSRVSREWYYDGQGWKWDDTAASVNQWDNTGQGNQGDNTGAGNHWDTTGQGNQWDNTGMGNQGDNTGEGNHWDNTGEGNQWDNTGEGNQWDNTGTGNQWDNTGQGNHWDNTGQGNHWDNTGQGNHWDNTGEGNQWDNTGTGNQGDNTGQGNQWDNTGQGNQWDNSGAGNQGDDTGAGNHWDNTGAGNHWDNTGAGNQWDNTGEGNQWDNIGQGNHWDNTGQGNQWDNTGTGNQGDNTGAGNQGDNTEEAGNTEGADSGWPHAGFSTNDQCNAAPLRGDQYSHQSIASDDLPIKPNCGRGIQARSLLELLLQARIVGGQQSDRGQWPWLAALGAKADGQSCGATLISDQWVLTAAHCFEGQTIKPCDQNVRLGEHNLNLKDGQHADMTPSKVIIHPEYDSKLTANDIALVKLSKPAAMSDYINVACLPSDVNDIDTSSCVVAGWGAINNKGDSSSTVKHVTAPILSQSTCEQAYPGSILHGMMCAGHLQGGKDSCQGDSGGPLMCKSRTTGRYSVAGVVSWGEACGGKGKPGVYTEVLKYIDWIEWVISKN